MRFYCISDNIDTAAGMRLAGIDGVVAHTAEEVNAALDSAVADEETAIVLITQKAAELAREKVYLNKMNAIRPLVTEIPDRHATLRVTDTIKKYVSEAIGVSL